MSDAFKYAVSNLAAKAKLIYNEERGYYRVVAAFNVTEVDRRGRLKFPVQRKCDYVSGDLCYYTLEKDLDRVIAEAKAVLRTDIIEFID